MNIFISNLSYNTVEQELQALFENYGEVESVKIVTDRETGRSRGFGFVEMPNSEEALKAIEGLHQTDYKTRVLNVVEAKPKESNSRGGGNGGFRRSNNNRY